MIKEEKQYADFIIHNGKLITMNSESNIEEAVAIKDNKILVVGTNEKIIKYINNETKVVNVEGRTVIPGLIDSHCHLSDAANEVEAINLYSAKSIEDILIILSENIKKTPKGEWIIVNSSWHEGALKEKRLPTRKELDTVSPNNPVLIPRGGHVIVANSFTLKLAGITKDTINPDGGLFIRDSETGEPNGIITGMPATKLVKRLLPGLNEQDKINTFKQMMKIENSYGVTSVTEPSIIQENINIYKEINKNKKMTVRITNLYPVDNLEDVKHIDKIYTQNEGDDYLKMGGLKYFIDGGIENAYMKDPYCIVKNQQESSNFYGNVRFPLGGIEELEEMFAYAAKKKWSIGTHAVGDKSIEILLDLYKKTNEKTPIDKLLWTVIHCFLPTNSVIEDMKRLGVGVTVQDLPLLLGNNMKVYWGENRANQSVPIRKLIDSGIKIGGGTDAPVVPLNPFYSLWWMVTRNTLTAGVLGKKNKITREEALYLFTKGSAKMQFKEDKIGSIEEGKLADLAVLNHDYLTISSNKIKDIKSLLTLVGGEIVYRNKEIKIKGLN